MSGLELGRIIEAALQVCVTENIPVDFVLVHELSEDGTASEWMFFSVGGDDSIHLVTGDVRTVLQTSVTLSHTAPCLS